MNEEKFLERLNSCLNKENWLNMLELENTNKEISNRFKTRKFLRDDLIKLINFQGLTIFTKQN